MLNPGDATVHVFVLYSHKSLDTYACMWAHVGLLRT